MSVRVFIVVMSKDRKRELGRVEKTHCLWCGNSEHVCSACVAKADAIRRAEAKS